MNLQEVVKLRDDMLDMAVKFDQHTMFQAGESEFTCALESIFATVHDLDACIDKMSMTDTDKMTMPDIDDPIYDNVIFWNFGK